MASLWPGKGPSEAPPPPSTNPSKDIADVADTGLADVGLPAPQTAPPSNAPAGRPQLSRSQPQPPPPHQPPPPPAPQQVGNPQDSLSLQQLRRIVTEFPKSDPISYAFTYADTASFEEEIDEWFSYNEAEFKRLERAKNTFGRRWKKFSGKAWLDANQTERQNFVEREINGLLATDLRRRCKSLQTILHIILGVWDETAGIELSNKEADAPKSKTRATQIQLEHMKSGILLVARAGGIPLLYEVMQNAFKRLW
jgi:hypothetical protein